MWYDKADPVGGRILEAMTLLEILGTKEPLVSFPKAQAVLRGADSLLEKAERNAADYPDAPAEEREALAERMNQARAILQTLDARLAYPEGTAEDEDPPDWSDLYDALTGALTLAEEAQEAARNWGKAPEPMEP